MPERSYRSGNGYTMIEMLIVVVIMGILMAISLPSYLQWRQNAEYRDAAQNILSILRNAKGRSIAANRQYLVTFEPVNSRYGMQQGNRQESTVWTDPAIQPITDWTVLNQDVRVGPAGPSIIVEWNPNGTVSLPAPVTVLITDKTAVTKYTITVIQSGRISLKAGS